MQASKFNLALNITVLIFSALFLCGCATSEYVGSDFDSSNVQTVKTNEDFVFKTYQKKSDNAIIKMHGDFNNKNIVLKIRILVNNSNS